MKFFVLEKEIKKAEVSVKPFMTKKGPRRGYKRFDPRERLEPKKSNVSQFGLLDANPDEFVKVRNKVPLPLQEYFTPYTPEEIRELRIKTFLTDVKDAGVAVKLDGDIVNLFSLEKGKGKNCLLHAILNGGRKLDCFDKKKDQEKGLPDYYKTFGFVEVKREKNWIEGEPDVVYMELPREGMLKSIGRNRMEEKDKTKTKWRRSLMKKFKGKDYNKMNQTLLEMMGEEATDEDRKFIRKE